MYESEEIKYVLRTKLIVDFHKPLMMIELIMDP